MIRWMEERKIFLRYVLLALLCLLLAAYLFYGDSDRAPGQERISYTVTRLSGANGWKAYVVEDGVRRDLHYEGGYFRGLAYEGQTYYMERTFGEDDLFRAGDGTAKPVSLHVRALWGHLSVFLDGALAFTDSPDQPAVIGQIDFDRTQPENLAGARAHYYGSQTSLRLTDYAGVTVTIAQNEIGIGMGERLYTCDAYVSTTAADTDRYIFTTFMHLIPPLLLLMVGVTLVVLFLYQAYHEQTQRVRLFMLALFALLWAANMYMEMPFYPYELPWRISLYGWSPWYFYIVPLLVYLCLSMRRCRVPMAVLLILYTGAAVLEYAGVLHPEVADDLVLVTCLSLLITVEWTAGRTGLAVLGGAVTLGLAALSAYYIAMHVVWGAYSWHTLRVAYACTKWLYALHAALFTCCVFVEVRGVIRAAMRKNSELRLLRAHEELALESYAQMASYTEEIAHIRHDIRNHLMVLRTLLDDEGQPARAGAYLSDLLRQDAAVGRVVHTGNYLIDTVVGGKLAEARRHGIPVVFAEVSDPGPMAIPESDLASVLMNILDNAIEASQRVEDPQRRHIELRMHAKGRYGFFSCENAIDAPPVRQGGRLRSSKADDAHGYGMAVIHKTVAASGGLVDIQIEPGSFLIQVLIPLRGK